MPGAGTGPSGTSMAQKTQKKRLDLLMAARGLVESRQQAQGRILAGDVLVNGRRVTKAGTHVSTDCDIRLTGKDMPYVSRGGVKLEAALNAFHIDVRGLACLDVGASTGGFTDCLLKRGAQRVAAIDVGYGQLHWSLRSDPRVIVLERTNIRHLETIPLPHPAELACIDVSFISLKMVVPAVLKLLQKPGRIVCLIKPQFEVGKNLVGKGGVVRDPSHHQKVVDDLTSIFVGLGLRVMGVFPSPLLGPKGNKEFFMCLEWTF